MSATTPPDDVRRWLDRQAEPDRAELARTWDLAVLAASGEPVPDADAAWAAVTARLGAEPAAPPVPGPPRSADRVQAGLRAWRGRGGAETVHAATAPVRSFLLARRPALAGVLLAAAAVALAVVLWPRTTVVEAGGAVLAVALPDGSAVTLAPGSELAYRRGLPGDERRVRLDGGGYFDVAHDGRPFVVETFNAEVEVLGTAFDVLAWPGAQAAETAVALVEGSVRLRGSGGAVVLAPGEVARVAGAVPTPPVVADVAAAAAWRGGGFSVVDAPLGVVAAALEGRFGRPVRLGPGVDAARRLTLFLPSAESADAVLRDVAAYLDLRLQVGPDRYDLLPR